MFPLGSRSVPEREPRTKRILLLDRLISVRAVLRSFPVLLIFLSTAASSDVPEPVSNRPAKQPFTIDDYFKIKRVTELALSSDGEMIAYAVEWQSLEENKALPRIYVSKTTPGAEAELIEDIQDARGLAWIPGRHELAFLSGRNGAPQIFSYDVTSREVRRRTESKEPVIKFRFAPDGRSIAYVTQVDLNKEPSLYDLFQTGDQGILIDTDIFRVQHFINPDWPKKNLRPKRNLYIESQKSAIGARIPGNVKSFYWSSDSAKLSVTYLADQMPSSYQSELRTSLGIYILKDAAFKTLASADFALDGQGGRFYSGGEWIPETDKILIRKATLADHWASRRYPDWAIVDLSVTGTVNEREPAWRGEIEIYGLDAEPAFIPVDETRIYTNKTVKAVRSLYQISPSGKSQAASMVRDVKGSVSFFRFSADFERGVFVNESLTRPPEIHIWRKGQGSRQLTSLNGTLARKTMPMAKEVIWKSKDGVTIHGWLLEPSGPHSGNKPWPLVTFVHGSSITMPKEFAAYFPYWPYPFEAYALNGMAVFMPNHRSTLTYGRKFAYPRKIDGEPVEDIVSGIESLVQRGIADPDRLGISGHSHGGWLAPLVMTRARIFQAGAFADGWSNMVTVVNTMPGIVHRHIHGHTIGSSLYDDPERYIELSPDLHFKGLRTAVLFEAASEMGAINMLGFPNAARHAGMPTEYFIYPKTGHNPSIPRIQKESAERNLDWFRFWLKGEKDPSSQKVDQYVRWKEMREQQKKTYQIEDRPIAERNEGTQAIQN